MTRKQLQKLIARCGIEHASIVLRMQILRYSRLIDLLVALKRFGLKCFHDFRTESAVYLSEADIDYTTSSNREPIPKVPSLISAHSECRKCGKVKKTSLKMNRRLVKVYR